MQRRREAEGVGNKSGKWTKKEDEEQGKEWWEEKPSLWNGYSRSKCWSSGNNITNGCGGKWPWWEFVVTVLARVDRGEGGGGEGSEGKEQEDKRIEEQNKQKEEG